MTSLHALNGTDPAGMPAAYYYGSEDQARAALPDLVLTGLLRSPIRLGFVNVEEILSVPAVGDAGRERLRDALVAAVAEMIDAADKAQPDTFPWKVSNAYFGLRTHESMEAATRRVPDTPTGAAAHALASWP